MDIALIRGFLGWCSVINFGLLLLSSIVVIVARKSISHLHAKIFNLDEKLIAQLYFQYLAHYKIAIIVFNIVPYLALRVMG